MLFYEFHFDIYIKEVYTAPDIPVDYSDYQHLITDGLKLGEEQSKQLFIIDQVTWCVGILFGS